MICLCCGKPIKDPQKANNGWHHTCIKRFFGTKELPELNLSADTIESIANECTRRGFTVPGVQKKLSLHLSNEKNDKVRLTLVGYPARYGHFFIVTDTERMILHRADAVETDGVNLLFGSQGLVVLLSVRWALSEKTSGVYPLMQESILTIPTFQALNVRFSVKIFAKIFEPAQKQGFHDPDE